jgi:nucleotide-binding universal stress UspA family protein
MLPFARILLPVDFSERMPGAARYARTVACRFKSEVTLVHVLEPPHYELSGLELGGGPALVEHYRNREAQAQEDLDKCLVNELAGIAVKRFLLEGDPASTLVKYAHDEKMNLIVMPTHGYGIFRRFILGSVAAKVLHDAECPVLTGIHMEEAPPFEPVSIHKIVCALDLGPHCKRVLDAAVEMTAAFNAHLTLVHATPELEAGQSRYFDPDWRIMLANNAREQIDKLREHVSVLTEVVVEPGSPPAVVSGAARSADLVVIGRDQGTLGRLRGNAYAIIRESPCAVLSI